MNKFIMWVVVIVLIVWGISAVSKKGEPKSTEPIKIGFIGPLTGDAASIGTVSQAAVQVAVEEVNANGGANGRQLEVIYEDGKCGAPAAQAANKLISADGVDLIIGGLCSGETSSFVKGAMEQKVPVISYCSSAPNLTGSGKYFFRDYPTDTFQGKFSAEYLYNTLGARKVAVFYHISDWGTGLDEVFTKTFKELGGEIVAEEGTAQTVRDYRTQIAKIKSLSPDYIYMPMYPEGGTVALTQLNQLGVKIKIFGADAWSDTKLQKDVSGKGDILYSEAKVPDNEEFKNKVLAKTKGTQIPICAPQAYDALKLAAQVVGKVGTDPDKFADALRATSYEGVSGKISFDQNGDLMTSDYVVKRIENGTAVEAK